MIVALYPLSKFPVLFTSMISWTLSPRFVGSDQGSVAGTAITLQLNGVAVIASSLTLWIFAYPCRAGAAEMLRRLFWWGF